MSPRGHGAGGPGPGTTALRLLPRLSAAALVRPINTPCHVSQHHYFYTTEKSKKKTNHYLEHEQDSCGEAAEPISLPAPSPAGRQQRGPTVRAAPHLPLPLGSTRSGAGHRVPNPFPMSQPRGEQGRCDACAQPHMPPRHPSTHLGTQPSTQRSAAQKKKSFAKPVSNVKSYFPNWLLHLQSSSLAAAVGSQGQGEDGSPPLRLLSSPVPNRSGGRQSL